MTGSGRGDRETAEREIIAQALHDFECIGDHALSAVPNHAAPYYDRADMVIRRLNGRFVSVRPDNEEAKP